MSSCPAHRGGFTILEVLVAIFVVGTVLSAIVALVGTNLSQLARVRSEIDQARLAEERLRAIESELMSDLEVRDGVEEGRFDPPNEDLVWRTSVSPFSVPLPALDSGIREAPPLASALFTSPSRAVSAPPSAPAIRLVEVRVYREADGPERAAVLEWLHVEPYVPPETEPSEETTPTPEQTPPGSGAPAS